MFSKVYENLKKIIKENIVEILILLLISLFAILPLPYYVDMPGGLLNTAKRVDVDGATKSKGSYNLAYVSEAQATPVLYLLSKIIGDWDIVKEEDMLIEGQTIEDLYIYERLLLKQASTSAQIVAYKKAEKELNIISEKFEIGYITKDAETDLKVGDQIVSIEGKEIININSIKEFLGNKGAESRVTIEVINDGKKVTKYAVLKKIDNEIVIGIGIFSNKEIETNPKCELKFERKESGPSGGLMTALTIYDDLIEEDLTHGLRIAGTGTIEEDGTVGEIGGVKYKLAGVVKNKADVFLVPAGDNYEEAIKLKEKNNYDIEIVSIANFDEAVGYLKKLK